MIFGGQKRLEEIYTNAITKAPASAAPLAAVVVALEAAVPVFQGRNKLVRQRQAVIAANAGLQERELLKGALLTSVIAKALRSRGVPDLAARIAAEIGAIAFKNSV